MFTPPHEFAINIPQILAQARMETYRRWSWPDFLGRAFKNRSVTVFLAIGIAALVAVLALFFIPSANLFAAHVGPGAFYEVVPYIAMVAGALILLFYGLAVWLRGGARFWRETKSALNEKGSWKSLAAAVGAVLGLRYLKGGGHGCFYPDERPSSVRRIYHSLTFWGLLSDFVSTTLAFIYQDFFHQLPPYALLSAPVIFGVIGGVALILGTGGLIYFKLQSDRAPAEAAATGMDYVFLVTLGFTALTGMLTLILRTTPAMGSILVLHLACIAALFLSAPYGKFVHAVYRTLAIIRYEIEQSQSHEHVGH
jgi:citrate/tricarballylate utilization protein